MSHPGSEGLDLETFFGPLEMRVLEALWTRGEAAVVRDLLPDFPELAYTTVMTTLDRLYRKGVLLRFRSGRAYAYRAALTRDELSSGLAGSVLASLMPDEPRSIRPLLTAFVDEVGQRDLSLLDELEAEIQRRREELE